MTSLSRKSLKDSVNVANDEIVPLTFNFKYMQWYIVTIDSISKLCKPELPKAT